MKFLKLYWHVKTILVMFFYKMIYRNKLKFSKISVRSGLKILIDSKGSLKIGKGCFFNHNCSLNVMGKLVIGENCLFGENIKIYDHDHKFQENKELIKKQGYKIKDIKIGNNCWIGSNVIILKGVKIGDHAVIGAGTIVTKDIAENAIVYQKRIIETK